MTRRQPIAIAAIVFSTWCHCSHCKQFQEILASRIILVHSGLDCVRLLIPPNKDWILTSRRKHLEILFTVSLDLNIKKLNFILKKQASWGSKTLWMSLLGSFPHHSTTSGGSWQSQTAGSRLITFVSNRRHDGLFTSLIQCIYFALERCISHVKMYLVWFRFAIMVNSFQVYLNAKK